MSLGLAPWPGTTFHLMRMSGRGVLWPENSPPLPAQPVETFLPPEQPIGYRVPDCLTFGIGIRTFPAFTFVADLGLVRFLQRVTGGFLIVDFLGQTQSSGLTPSLYFYPYVVELHAGGEYRRRMRG